MTNDDKESETYDEEENTIFSSEEEEEEEEEEDEPIPAKKKDSGSGDAHSLKRHTEETQTARDVNPKRAKKVITVEGEEKIRQDSKKLNSNRVWNEENEIALLKGVIDFKADTGKNPVEDWHGFYGSVKKSITLDASLRQYVDKIRHLKRKYLRKTKNEPMSFSNANDRNCFELSKFIWGSQGICSPKSDVKTKSVKKKMNSLQQELFTSPPPNAKDVEDLIHKGGGLVELPKSAADWFEKSVLVRSIEILGVDEESVKERWSKVPMETKNKFEEMWKLVKAKEFECLLQKTHFLHQVASVIAEIN